MLISYKKPKGRFFIVGKPDVTAVGVQYNISIVSSDNNYGYIEVDGVSGDYTQTLTAGTQLSLRAVPNNITGDGRDVIFTEWRGNNYDFDNPTTYTVSGDDSIIANFSIERYIYVTVDSSKYTILREGSQTMTQDFTDGVISGECKEYEVIPETGYQFDGWLIDGVLDGDTSNPRYFCESGYDYTVEPSVSAATPAQPNDEIWYTSTDSQTITPGTLKDNNGSNLTILSNTYSNGKGVIKASGDIYSTSSLFNSQTNLETVSYPSTVTYVGGGDCLNCTNLVSVDFPNSLDRIGGNAFKNCTGLTSINIPSSVTKIDGGCFENCTGLTGTLVLPSGLTTIGGSAFKNCNSFTGTLTLPNTLTNIGNSAFQSCSGFTGTLVLPSGLVSLGKAAFQSCSGFTGTLTIPSLITSISESLVISCSNLTSVIIPDSVTSIGKSAFAVTGITTVSLGNVVTELKNYVFENCSLLTSITFTSTTIVPTLGTNVFYNVASSGTVYGQPGLDYSTIMSALPSGWTLVQ